MVYGDEWFVEGLRQGFGIGDTKEERADEAGALGDADGVDVVEGEVGFGEGFADYWNDLAEMFAGGEFGDDAAVLTVNVDLRSDDRGENFAAVGDHGGGGFIAGGF